LVPGRLSFDRCQSVSRRSLVNDGWCQTLAPLSSSAGERVGLIGEHGPVDDVGEAAFEDA
jgi:hypothetical protein